MLFGEWCCWSILVNCSFFCVVSICCEDLLWRTNFGLSLAIFVASLKPEVNKSWMSSALFTLTLGRSLLYSTLVSTLMKTRFVLSIVALFFACSVLVLSLISARDVSAGDKASSQLSLSFGKQILPDNLLYPVVMTVDRVELETAPAYERVFMQLEYADRRLGYAQELLIMKKSALALSTLTKAENYLHNAVQEYKEIQAPDPVKQRLIKDITYHSATMKEMGAQFNDADRAVVDRMIEQNQAILLSL
jgi:hypothetical protein